MSDTVTTPVTADAGKHFTPEQVEQIVKERLARDREARKDENAEKALEAERKLEEAKAALQTANTQIETLRGTSATAEEMAAKIKASHAKIIESIPPEKRKYIPSGYSEAEQIGFITQNNELFFTSAPVVKSPETPPPVNPQGAGGGGDPKFGGYTSLVEWAQRDPHGYSKARAKG